MSSNQRIVLVCLAGLGLALLLVGITSGTLLRHIVQLVPTVVALVLVMHRPSVGAYAAIPIFGFWIAIVVVIWLFLLGVSKIANGHLSLIEIISTVFMIGFSLAGFVKSIRLGVSLRPIERVLAFILFGVLQVVAMRISFVDLIANR